MIRLLSLLISWIFLADAALDSDFDKLKVGIKALYDQNPRMIPLAVRLVFHDLLLQPAMAGKGCIELDPFLNNGLNNGLRTVVSELQRVVKAQNITDGTLTIGDVIAFAGKLAVEAAYPCINIPFMYNRGACTTTAPSNGTGNAPPGPTSMKLADYNDHVKYVGMTHSEFAILVIGGHGIREASAHIPVSGWDGVFSTFSSGKDFIVQTLSNTWISRENPKLEFVATINTSNTTNTTLGSNTTLASNTTNTTLGSNTTNTTNTTTTLLRIPSDMVFFPDVIPVSATIQKDVNALPVQESLRNFTTQPRIKFDQAFADVFSKLISRAGGKTIYREKINLGFCPEFPGEQPPTKQLLNVTADPTTTAEPSTSSAQHVSGVFVALFILLLS